MLNFGISCNTLDLPVHKSNFVKRNYRPDIDGLRALAVFAVVVFHAFPSYARGGFIGVDVFFVISGYLISSIIFDDLNKGTFSFSLFYTRRIKRIFPALLIVLISSFIFGYFSLLPDEYKQLGSHIAAGASFISNYILSNEAGYFDNLGETKPLLHLWSLAIEEQFYIIWPLFLYIAWKRKFNLLIITTLIAISSFMLNLKGVKQDTVGTFYSLQTRFWELLSGSLLAYVMILKKEALYYFQKKTGEANKMFNNSLSFFGLLLILLGVWGINKELSFPGKFALIPIFGTLLIIMAGSQAWANKTILSNKILVWFGLISFPMYLWHWPLLSFTRIVLDEAPSRNIRIGVVILSAVLAWLTYKLVEEPMRSGNHGKIKVAFLVILISIVGFAGYSVYKKNGLTGRNENTISPQNSIKDIKCNGKGRLKKIPDQLTECLGLHKKDKRKSLYLIGDSHAAQFIFPLKTISKELNINLYFINTENPNDIVYSMFSAGDMHKDRIVKHLLKVLNKGDLLILTFYRGHLNNPRDQDSKVESDVDFSPSEKNFYINFNSIKNLFFNNGIRIVLIKDGPFLESLNPKLCLEHSNLLRYSKKKCELNYEIDNYGRTIQTRLFDRLASENKGNIIVLDPLRAIYQDKNILLPYDSKTKKYIMFDDNHLTEYGSMLSLGYFKYEFLRILNLNVNKNNEIK